MAKIKYDVSDVEEGVDFDTPVPKGNYRCEITEMTEGESSRTQKPMLTIEYTISTGDWKGRKLWDYIVLDDASAWKMAQLVRALGLKDKGQLDTDKVVGERVMVRAKHEVDDRQESIDANDGVAPTRARPGSVNPLPGTDDEEPEEEEGDDDDDGAGEDYTYEDLEAMDRADLKGVIKEEDLDVRVTKTMKDETVLVKVAEALGVEAEEEEPEEEEPDDDDDDEALTYEDLEEYDREDLEGLVEEEELDVKFNSKTKDDVLRERIAEALELEPEGEGEDDDEEEEEEQDYASMPVADLRAAAKERGLNPKGRKALLVKRLEKDDASGDSEPF